MEVHLNKKKSVALVAILILLAFAFFTGSANTPVGICTTPGFGGDVTVAVYGSGGAIKDIRIDGRGETPEIGGAAIPILRESILQAGSADVDSVSGATVTSNAVKYAAAYAIAVYRGEALPEAPDMKAGKSVDALSGSTAVAEVTGSGGYIQEADTGCVLTPGTYEASEKGYKGDVIVTMTVDEKSIIDLSIKGEEETPAIGGAAIAKLAEDMLTAQTSKVDAVSGATMSSTAAIKAATEALTAAGASEADIRVAQKQTPTEIKSETLDCDIVIVGAGGAGMTAAINATQAGKNVIILEKMAYPGGNTTRATGGMNAAETHYQAEQGIEDSVDQFVEDTMKAGHDINDEALVRIMAEKSSEGIDWLDSIGAKLPNVSFSGGATNARIHAPEDGSGVGEFLVDAFQSKLDELGIEIMYNTKATEILVADGKASGVLAEAEGVEYTINAKTVILATGGFGASEDMILKYRPDLKGTVTTNAPGATGDGILMAEALGADLVDIEQIQLHPTVEQTTSTLITEGVRGDGAILVNQSGKRFIDELQPRDVVSAGELEQEGYYAYIIFDQRLREGRKAIEKYVSGGLTVESDTIEGLAEQLDIDPEVLKDTLDTWNEAVSNQEDKEFGRKTAMEYDLSQAPYYAIKIAPGIHHTMGGIKINTNAEVIDKSGNVIPGLFAAGEVVGGVHGGNRVGGNAVADIVVFGKVASDSAVSYVK